MPRIIGVRTDQWSLVWWKSDAVSGKQGAYTGGIVCFDRGEPDLSGCGYCGSI
jgi:hypothetical protein